MRVITDGARLGSQIPISPGTTLPCEPFSAT